MKLTFEIKDPDQIQDYLFDVFPGLGPAAEKARSEISKKFFRFGEYATVELDTDDSSWRFVPV